MAPRGLVTVTTVLLLCILGLLSPAPAAHGRSSSTCCRSYTRKPLAFRLIKGFKEQSSWENCHIDAIIFYTIKNRKICATSKDDWVRKALARLSSKLKKMSKATGEAVTNRSGTSAGGGSFFNGTGTFLNLSGFSNSTETLY